MVESVSRRAAIGAVALAGGFAALRPAAAQQNDDPRRGAVGQIKMEACLDGHPAVWAYSGLIYAVQEGRHPRAILAISGGYTSWAQPLTQGA